MGNVGYITKFSIIISAIGVFHAGPGAQSQPTSDVSGSFTASTGRTILYRYRIKTNWNTTQPRGLLIFFHGNSRGTPEDMLRAIGFVSEALDLGLVPVVVASPNSLRPDAAGDLFGWEFEAYGTRAWLAPDRRLVHELLQSGFNSNLAVDHNQIVFMGGSQGACFLADFFEQYAGIYGGGFHAWCGCYWAAKSYYNPPRLSTPWRPTFEWTPFSASFVRSRFRVFVEATTGDKLHDQAVAVAKHYSEVLDLETRSDLAAPGGHCSKGATPNSEIWKWLSSIPVPDRTADILDVDGDGLENAVDPDDDNDGAMDFIDALPLDPKGYLDTDLDGIGDYADRDADGDGTENDMDPFPLDPREWLDSDEDGIGNNLDADDDNDGIPDNRDSHPVEGSRNDQLAFRKVDSGVNLVYERYPRQRYPAAFVHRKKPVSIVYPKPEGDQQSYQYINLGDSDDPRFEIMIDRFNRTESCETVLLNAFCNPETDNLRLFEHYIDRIYIDRNHNQNLTDDGPPLLAARNKSDIFSDPGVITVIEVPYATGDVFPYGIKLWAYEDLSDGARFKGASVWMGHVKPPSGDPVLVGVIDANLDGVFSSGKPAVGDVDVQEIQDFVCIDLDRNGVLDECETTEDPGSEDRVSPVYPGRSFELDAVQYLISVAPSGHKVTIYTEQNGTPQRRSADFDGDGTVGFPDFLLFAGAWGLGRGDAGYDARFDLDDNGTIGFRRLPDPGEELRQACRTDRWTRQPTACGRW